MPLFAHLLVGLTFVLLQTLTGDHSCHTFPYALWLVCLDGVFLGVGQLVTQRVPLTFRYCRPVLQSASLTVF